MEFMGPCLYSGFSNPWKKAKVFKLNDTKNLGLFSD